MVRDLHVDTPSTTATADRDRERDREIRPPTRTPKILGDKSKRDKPKRPGNKRHGRTRMTIQQARLGHDGPRPLALTAFPDRFWGRDRAALLGALIGAVLSAHQ